ncbi:MAG TPA: 30S ribosomal protein S8 [Candidatus Saccharimonadales bacterium]|nr:30S ribosomal protein S8 [Candidatus Saccharimonadales bacterium]
MSKVSTDPIADMLTRIRNAVAVRKSEVLIPHSKVKESVAELLKNSGFIDGVNVVEGEVGKTIEVTIHGPEANARITNIKRLSTPGRRMYAGAQEIPTVKQGRGIVIISTSKGVMTGADAKAQGVGGELICTVY